MKGKLLVILIAFLLGLAFFNCKQRDSVPLNSIDLEIKIKRLDKALFSTKEVNNEFVKTINKAFNPFFSLFCERVIGIGKPGEGEFNDFLNSFLTDNMVNDVKRRVDEVFPNTEELDEELTNAFKRIKFYFPQKETPIIFGFISGFNNSIVIADSVIGIGFDRYLGRNCDFYPKLGVHKYLTYNMHPAKIPSDVVRSYAIGEFVFNDSIDNLLNNMIYEGMLMYFTSKALPNQPDSLIFGFTPKHMKFLKSNETYMWTYLVEHKLLFSTESFTIQKFIGEAPFTQGFPEESPGRAVAWVGYRIVKEYMDRNKEISLAMLMNERDYQKILNRSKYKP